MNRRVRLYKRKDPPIIDVFLKPVEGQPLTEQKPSLRATRLIIGAAPAIDESPDYACVIAEVYDPDPMQRERTKILLDDTIGLDPADYTEAERVKFDINPNAIINPTLGNFRRGLVALTQLYQPQEILLPGSELDWTPETLNEEFTTNKFYRAVILTEGIRPPDPSYSGSFDRWFPQGYRHLAGVRTIREDVIFQRRLVDNLFALKKFHHYVENPDDPQSPRTIYEKKHTQYESVRRAAELALAEMQDRELLFETREWEEGDGYTDMAKVKREKEEEDVAREEALLEYEAKVWQATGQFPDLDDEERMIT